MHWLLVHYMAHISTSTDMLENFMFSSGAEFEYTGGELTTPFLRMEVEQKATSTGLHLDSYVKELVWGNKGILNWSGTEKTKSGTEDQENSNATNSTKIIAQIHMNKKCIQL